MTIERAQELKREMEQGFERYLDGFTATTGLRITDLSVEITTLHDAWGKMDDTPPKCKVRLRVEL